MYVLFIYLFTNEKNVTILKCYILEVLKQNLKGQTQWDHAQILCQNAKISKCLFELFNTNMHHLKKKHYLFNETRNSIA